MCACGGDKLLSPWTHQPSGLTLQNRVFMAPMTRARAGATRMPGDMTAAYYAARATAGLIITESITFSPHGHGWPGTPALETEEQVQCWRRVVNAVHAEGGLISAQLAHMGRASHSSYRADASPPVAPSAIAISGRAYLSDGSRAPYEVPRALDASELPEIAQSFADAALRARHAGFDFVEVHAGNGFLLDTFLQSSTNQRTDAYGGPPEHRFRFLEEVLEAVTRVLPAGRVGVRLSPNATFNGMGSAHNVEAFSHYTAALSRRQLGWLHIVGPPATAAAAAAPPPGKGHPPFELAYARRAGGPAQPIIANCDFTQTTAESAIGAGDADAVAFGRPFLSNPDLVSRFHTHAPLAQELPMSLWYSSGPEGYTDLSMVANGVPAERG